MFGGPSGYKGKVPASTLTINSVRPITTRVAYVEDGELKDLKIEQRGAPTWLVPFSR